jgi:hypothetical protein
MAIHVKFAYVCRFKFTDLPGDSNDLRHCNQCNLDVTNLDAMGDDAATRFLEDAHEDRRQVCVAATVRPANIDSCSNIGGLNELAGKPAPPPRVVIDVIAPKEITAEQCALLMDALELANREAVTDMFKGKKSIRLGAYRKWKLRERITDSLDKVGLKWTMTEVHFDDDLYWELEVKS